jgi:pimeloyl-ACP methyl ester carboxylesterase
MTTSPEQLAASLTAIANDSLLDTRSGQESPYFVNSESFATSFITNDPGTVGLVLYDHVVNDWRDVVRRKIDVPAAIFSGELSPNLPSQQWLHSVIADASLYTFSKSEYGDHFLMFKNPLRFTRDLRSFLEQGR